jgi:hypothetical protein
MRSQSSCCEDLPFVIIGATISTIRKLGATVFSLSCMVATGIATAIGATCLAGAVIGEYAFFGGFKVASGIVVGATCIAASALTCLGAGITFAGHSLSKAVGGILGLVISGTSQAAAFVAEPAIKFAGGFLGGLACGALSLASATAGAVAIPVLFALTVTCGVFKVLGSGLAATAGIAASALTCLGAGIGCVADVASFAINNVAILAYNSVTTNPIEFQELNTTNRDKIWEHGINLAQSCFATFTDLLKNNWEDVGAIITSPAACIFNCTKSLGNLSKDLIIQQHDSCIAEFAKKIKDEMNKFATDLGKESYSLLSENWIGENSPCQTAKAVLESGFDCAKMLRNEARDLLTNNWKDVGAIITSPTACIFNCTKSLGNLSKDLIIQQHDSCIAEFAKKIKDEMNKFTTDLGKESYSLLSENWIGENSPCQNAKAVLKSGFDCAEMLLNEAKDLLTNNWKDVGAITSGFYEHQFKPWAESLSDHSQKTLCRGVATVFEATTIPQFLAYQGGEEESTTRLGINRDKWAEWAQSSPEDSWQKWFCANAASTTLREIVSSEQIGNRQQGGYNQVA